MSNKRAGKRLLSAEEREEWLWREKRAIEAEAHSQLRSSGYHDLHLVSCEFHEGVLTLRGRVPSFHLKQISQTLIGEMDDVEVVNNRLEVDQPKNPLTWNEESGHG